MKTFLIIFILCFNVLGAFAQFSPSGCGSISASVNADWLNNNSAKTYNFDKRQLACDETESNAFNGFSFKAQYTVPNRTGIKNIFSIRVGTSNTVMVFRFNNKKMEILRDVVYRPCNTWNNGVCQGFGSNVKGTMTFSTWDDNFFESNTGWVSVKLVDNGMEIKVSNNQNGPYKTEFNYEGLHLSGVDQELADTSSTNASIYIYANSSSNVTLSNITFFAGHFTPISAVVINDGSKSPETNFPTVSSRNHSGGKEEVRIKEFATLKLNLYPNPSQNGDFNIELELKEAGFANFKILNLNGQLVYQEENKTLEGGNHAFEFTRAKTNLASGLYLINVTTNEFSQMLKLIVD